MEIKDKLLGKISIIKRISFFVLVASPFLWLFFLIPIFDGRIAGTLFALWIIISPFYYYVIRNIGTELHWISGCLIQGDKLEWAKRESKLYHVLTIGLRKDIKKGMHIDEIKKYVDKMYQESLNMGGSSSNYAECFYAKCLNSGADERGKKYGNITICGFGECMPTPRLTFYFKNWSLISWHNSATSRFPWHDKSLMA
jgi:hypothetical protein